MSDAKLRELERRVAATGDRADERALDKARERAGLCPRCGQTPHVPDFTGPPCAADDGAPFSAPGSKVELPAHAPGTRARECRACDRLIYKRIPGRAKTSRWTAAARGALEAALRTSACRTPAGLALACRRAKPWEAYKAGNGMAWANHVWTRELARALGTAQKQRCAGRSSVPEGHQAQQQLFGGTS